MFPESRCIGMVNHTPGRTPHQSDFGGQKSPAHRKSENIIEIMEQSRQGKLLKFVDR